MQVTYSERKIPVSFSVGNMPLPPKVRKDRFSSATSSLWQGPPIMYRLSAGTRRFVSIHSVTVKVVFGNQSLGGRNYGARIVFDAQFLQYIARKCGGQGHHHGGGIDRYLGVPLKVVRGIACPAAMSKR